MPEPCEKVKRELLERSQLKYDWFAYYRRRIEGLEADGRRMATRIHNQRAEIVRLEASRATAAVGVPVALQVGTLHVQHFRGAPEMENLEYVPLVDLPPGSHALYATPQLPVLSDEDIEEAAASVPWPGFDSLGGLQHRRGPRCPCCSSEAADLTPASGAKRPAQPDPHEPTPVW